MQEIPEELRLALDLVQNIIRVLLSKILAKFSEDLLKIRYE